MPKYRLIIALVIAYTVIAVAAHAQTFDSLVSLDGTNGASPQFASLVQGPDGNLYGTTVYGGIGQGCAPVPGCGTVFRLTPTGRLTTLYSFCVQSACADGSEPYAGVSLGTDGNFYGTTGSGGTKGWGTVYRITPGGRLTTLYNFCSQPDCSDGAAPVGALVEAEDGNFYGTTNSGGTGDFTLCTDSVIGCGTIFRITSNGKLKTLYSFCTQPSCSDGNQPYGALVQGSDGNLYGTTFLGGVYSQYGGTVFKITLSGTLTTLHSFNQTDGREPLAGLVQAEDGKFYGTAQFALYRVASNGAFSLLVEFPSAVAAPLIQATDGRFYGAAEAERFNNVGAVFLFTLADHLKDLHNFDVDDGAVPFGGLFQATNGLIYGMTYGGGFYREGTIYSLDLGLGPFVTFVRAVGKVGQTGGILGQGFNGTSSVTINGLPANFTVKSDTYLTVTVPSGATTGYVTVTTPSGTLTSNVPFRVIQ